MSGFVILHRTLWEHPVFRDGIEAGAFAWMISQAAWQTTRVRYKDRIVTLERGQLAVSMRDLAKRFGWSEPTARRFLNRLKTDAMIDAASDAGVTIVTVCNYSKYQDGGRTADAPDDAHSDAVATHHRRTEQRREQGNKEDGGVEGRARPSLADQADDELSPPPPPAPTGTGSTDGKRLLAHWQGERRRLFPTNPNLPEPPTTSLATIAGWLREGAPPDLIADVISRGLERMAQGKRAPPVALSFFRNSMADALTVYRNADQPLPQGASNAAPAVNRPRQDRTDERRRDIVGAFNDLGIDLGGPG